MKSMPSIDQLGKQFDGLTHIRIHADAVTPIGRFLATTTPAIISTECGIFECIEGYIKYRRYEEAARVANLNIAGYNAVLAKLEPLRNVSGKDAIKTGGSVHSSLIEFVNLNLKLAPSEEQAIDVQRAIIQKFKTNPSMLVAALENKLPYAYYFQNNGDVVVTERFEWYPRQVTAAVAILKEIYR